MNSFVLFEKCGHVVDGCLPDQDVVMNKVVDHDLDSSGWHLDIIPGEHSQDGDTCIVMPPVQLS